MSDPNIGFSATTPASFRPRLQALAAEHRLAAGDAGLLVFRGALHLRPRGGAPIEIAPSDLPSCEFDSGAAVLHLPDGPWPLRLAQTEMPRFLRYWDTRKPCRDFRAFLRALRIPSGINIIPLPSALPLSAHDRLLAAEAMAYLSPNPLSGQRPVFGLRETQVVAEDGLRLLRQRKRNGEWIVRALSLIDA